MDIIAMIPTYNEAGNIKGMIQDILALPLDIGVLVADDNSPDGTARIVEEMTQADPRVHLLLRTERRGRGWAGIDGFKKALELGAEYVVEMDGDRSHDPRYIPALLEAAKKGDVAIGSRYVAGGKDEARSFLRRGISGFARRYLAAVLGVSLQDPTSGYRLFSRRALEAILPFLSARDPFIVSEVIFHLKRRGMAMDEVPIEFMSRGAGESKLKPSTLFKYLVRVWELRLKNYE